MAGRIYVIQGASPSSETLLELKQQEYEAEALLQRLIGSYPHLLAGDQMDEDEPRRWLLITREAPIPQEERGPATLSLDHLFLDQDAVPTLIEVKRSTDSRIRREVVGQMLDYAANAVKYFPVESLKARFEARCAAEQSDPEEKLGAFLHTGDPTTFWQTAKTNLQAGKIRMVIVADEIPQELQRIVEFLNEQMDPAEVLAVEIRQYVADGLRTLVPRVLGQTSEARRRKGISPRERRQWDESQFLREIEEKRTAPEIHAAQVALRWAKNRGLNIVWGTGLKDGSFSPFLLHEGTRHPLFSVYSNGWLEVPFYWMREEPFEVPERRSEVVARLNAVPGVSIAADAIGRRPNISLAVLGMDKRIDQVVDVFGWMVEEIRKPTTIS